MVPHPPWSQLVTWSRGTAPGWKAQGKTHWSSWGNDFPKTFSGDHCVTHTPGMERGHTSTSWFSRGQRGLHQKTSEGSQGFTRPWGAADLESFLQSKLRKTKSPNSNTIPGCVLPGNLSWEGPGRWFQKSRAESTEHCCLPEAEARQRGLYTPTGPQDFKTSLTPRNEASLSATGRLSSWEQ